MITDQKNVPRASTGSFVPFTIVHTCSTNVAGEPRFSLELIRKNYVPDTTDDLDASELSQLVTRLLDLRDAIIVNQHRVSDVVDLLAREG